MGKNSYNTTEKQKELMIRALENNYGNVRKAAKVAKIAPSTHYRWLKEDRDYAQYTEIIKDIGFRNVRDNLLEKALEKINKGDSTVLNKMLGIYFKNVPQEMLSSSVYNNVPFRVGIKYVDNPRNPGLQGNIVWDGSKGKLDSGNE